MANRTRQAENSDHGKQSSNRLPIAWGGRNADGYLDNKKPESYFNYIERPVKREKRVYKYSTKYKKLKWKSYNKRY